ncbi:virB8 family protein [Qipengyuania sediminis]|uniref:virB8 family protein n=1 Tax=Qipengyuania sediminis TaxID=1532023 RepID=UPI00105A3CB4|nr:type IV secretion system protein [Qipengyuania sediminis]
MNIHHKVDGDDVFVADSWGASVTADLERSRRTAWIVAAAAVAIALLLALALVILLPLKQVEPYTLLVDRQTGAVQTLKPLDVQTIAPDAALTRSFLVQYVIARESFYADSFDSDYRKVTLWSAGPARRAYIDRMQPNNPLSPLAWMPRGGTIEVAVRSVSPLDGGRTLVRFTTFSSNPGTSARKDEHWVAVVGYGFSQAPMSEADRLLNPLGFQVTSYRRDAESLPKAFAPRDQAARSAQAADPVQ